LRAVGISLEKFTVSTVAKAFSLRERATHAVFHGPADSAPLCTCSFDTIEDGGHLTVACTDASSVEGDESFSQQQGLAGAMQLMIGMRHECGEGGEVCSHRSRLRDSVQKEGRAHRRQ
jgi:hypothetical protein